jgi:hypothetical protein
VTPSQSRRFNGGVFVAKPVPLGQPAGIDQPPPQPVEQFNEGVTQPGSIWPMTALFWLAVAVVAIFVAAQSISPTRRLRAPSLRLFVRRPAPPIEP